MNIMIPIAFLIPATTNQREWSDIMETDLYMFLCQSLEINPPQGVEITLMIGYDHDDKLYSVFENRQKFRALFTQFKIEWHEYDASYSAGDSGNPNLPMTQFLIHKTHIQTFGWIFPPLIWNYFCDDFLNELYPKKYIHYSPELKLLNLGGTPRYNPKQDRKLCDMLLKRHRPAVNRLINKSSAR